MDFPAPIPGPRTRFFLSFTKDKQFRHEIYIETGDKTKSERIFEHLLQQRELFENEYGRPLKWEPLPDAKGCRIAEYLENADVNLEDRYDEFIDWLLDAGVRMRRALSAIELPMI